MARGAWWIVVVMLAMATPAEAKCARPPVQFSAAGVAAAPASVPANPEIFLFVPRRGSRTVTDVTTSAGKASLRHLSSVGSFDAYAVTVQAPAGRTITLRAVHDGDELATTVIRTEARSPTKEPKPAKVQIEKVSAEYREWTCSHNRTRNLEVSQEAPMYRLEWAHSRKDYLAGKRQTVVLPGTGVWRRGERTLKLGFINCAGETFDFQGKVIYAGVAALRHDGTVIAAADQSVLVTPP